MKYSITIEGETKKEIGDALYVFPEYSEEKPLKDIGSYCDYEEKTITAIRPMYQGSLNWNGALQFEFMTGTDAYYSEQISDFFKENSFRRIYFNKGDADSERGQRIKSIQERVKSMVGV